jgi:hypothetical protein
MVFSCLWNGSQLKRGSSKRILWRIGGSAKRIYDNTLLPGRRDKFYRTLNVPATFHRARHAERLCVFETGSVKLRFGRACRFEGPARQAGPTLRHTACAYYIKSRPLLQPRHAVFVADFFAEFQNFRPAHDANRPVKFAHFVFLHLAVDLLKDGKIFGIVEDGDGAINQPA